MFKVLIWDYVGISKQWLNQNADKKDIDIVATITPNEPVPELLLKRDAWDCLLIFEKNMREFFDVTLLALKLPPEKIIYALDTNSWLQHPKAICNILNDSGGIIRRWHDFINFRKQTDFITCTAEGLSYVATSKDNLLISRMYATQQNYSANDMKTFQALVKQYYGIDESTGYFLDIGANIGTTCIYFAKKLAPNLKVLAFEPDPENFKMLRINTILNDMDSKTLAVNCGLGDKFDEMTMYRNLSNPGANSIFKYENDMPSENIKIIPLDDYLAEKNIAAQDVKYIWIDTEGFEPQVVLGAKNLLTQNPAPIFMECNLGAWDKSGRFEDMMALLEKNYSHFILVENGKNVLCPLTALRTMEKSNTVFGRRGDIFLIRKGAID